VTGQPSLLQWLPTSGAGEDVPGITNGAGYDYLDELIVGVLRFEETGAAIVQPTTRNGVLPVDPGTAYLRSDRPNRFLTNMMCWSTLVPGWATFHCWPPLHKGSQHRS